MSLPLHANDPATLEPPTDILDEAHQRVVNRLLEDGYCKVTLEDVCDQLIERDRPKAIELLSRLCGLSQLHGDTAREEVDDIVVLAKQELDDFVERSDLVSSMLEDMEQEQIEEAMEEGEPYYGEAA